jgi:hypothetical protein
MQTPPYFPELPFRLRRNSAVHSPSGATYSDPFAQQAPSYWDTHPVGQIVGSIAVTSLKWGLVIYAIHFVYSLVAGTR